jgi:hypothetical protein
MTLIQNFLICLALIVSAIPSRAAEKNSGLDYFAGFGIRSMPFGAAGYAEAGSNHLLYGDYANPEEVFYGYLRPGVRLTSAISINAADAFISVYPVSFLGFTFGSAITHRSKDQSGNADCSLYQCDGDLRTMYGAVDLTLGAKGYFVVTHLVWTDFWPSGDGEDFYEDGAVLIGRRGYDRTFEQTYTAGKKIPNARLEDFFIGFGGRRTEAHGTGSFSERISLVGGHRQGAWRWTYAAGVHRSSLQALAPAFGVAVEWIGREGLALN